MRDSDVTKDGQPLSTEELLRKQNESQNWMYNRLGFPASQRVYVKEPPLPSWVVAVDSNGLSVGYEESYEDFQQRL